MQATNTLKSQEVYLTRLLGQQHPVCFRLVIFVSTRALLLMSLFGMHSLALYNLCWLSMFFMVLVQGLESQVKENPQISNIILT